jgi:hypothetical protein
MSTTIITSDGVSFDVDDTHIYLLGAVSELTRDLPGSDNIVLKEVSSDTIRFVMGFLPWLHENHAEIDARHKKERAEVVANKPVTVRPTDYEKAYFGNIADYNVYFKMLNEIDWITTPTSPWLLHCAIFTFSWLWIKDKTPEQIAAKWGFTDEHRKIVKDMSERDGTTMAELEKLVPKSIIDLYSLLPESPLTKIQA